MNDPLVDQVKATFEPVTRSEEQASVDVSPVAGILGIDNPSAKQRDQLEFIAGQVEGKDTPDLLFQLRSLEQRLAPPKLGETRLSVLYQYLRLQHQIKNTEKLRDTYLSGK